MGDRYSGGFDLESDIEDEFRNQVHGPEGWDSSEIGLELRSVARSYLNRKQVAKA